MDSEDYKHAKPAGAFLQSYDEPSGWILIEFWQKNYQQFVDYLNENFDEKLRKHIEFEKEMEDLK